MNKFSLDTNIQKQAEDLQNYYKKKCYARLHLLEQADAVPAPEYWQEAADLIESGLAMGKVVSERQKILQLSEFEPTMKGREYVKKLRLEMLKMSPQYQFMQQWQAWKTKIVSGFLGSVSTIITAIVTEWSTGAISRLLAVNC